MDLSVSGRAVGELGLRVVDKEQRDADQLVAEDPLARLRRDRGKIEARSRRDRGEVEARGWQGGSRARSDESAGSARAERASSAWRSAMSCASRTGGSSEEIRRARKRSGVLPRARASSGEVGRAAPLAPCPHAAGRRREPLPWHSPYAWGTVWTSHFSHGWRMWRPS